MNGGLPRDHISWSQVKSYHSCPACYYAAYFEEQPEQSTSIALPIGSAVHKAAQAGREARMAGTSLTPDEGATAAVEAFRTTVDAIATQGWDLGKYRTQADAESDVASFAKLVIELVSTEEGIIGVEQKFTLPEGIIPVPFIGFVDVLLENNGQQTVKDLKTASRSGAPDTWTAWQLMTYALPGWDQFSAPALQIDQVIKVKAPSLVSWQVTPTEAHMRQVIALIMDALDGILSERFPPRPSLFGCRYDHSVPVFTSIPALAAVA